MRSLHQTARFKRQLCYIACCTVHCPAAMGTCIDLRAFFYTDCRIVDALHLPLGHSFSSLMFAPLLQPQSSTMASGAGCKKCNPHAAIALCPKFIMATMIFPCQDLTGLRVFSKKDITLPSVSRSQCNAFYQMRPRSVAPAARCVGCPAHEEQDAQMSLIAGAIFLPIFRAVKIWIWVPKYMDLIRQSEVIRSE